MGRQERRAHAGKTDLKGLATSNTAFALDFYQGVKDQPGNLFFSPYSVSCDTPLTQGASTRDPHRLERISNSY